MRLILVRIWRDNLPKYGRPITKFFLGTVLTTGLGASILYKLILYKVIIQYFICSYIRAIEEILNDNSKFSKLDIPTVRRSIT